MADILYSWRDLEKNLRESEVVGHLHGDLTEFNKYRLRSPERIWLVRKEKEGFWLLGYLKVSDKKPTGLQEDNLKKNVIYYDPENSFLFPDPSGVRDKAEKILVKACAKMRKGNMQGKFAADILEPELQRKLLKISKEEEERTVSLPQFSVMLRNGDIKEPPYRVSRPGKRPSVDREANAERSIYDGAQIDEVSTGERLASDAEAITKQAAELERYMDKSEVDAWIKRRLGQGAFRESLLPRFEGACALSGITNRKVLIASHIKPWSKCANHEKRDPENGLLLSASWDAAFDKGLLTFRDDGTVVFSEELDDRTIVALGLERSAKLAPCLLTPKRQAFLAHHREHEFESWKTCNAK